MTVGSTLPLLPTAIGRMLLASIPSAELSGLLDILPNERVTPNTETDLNTLAETIRSARETGHSIVQGEYERGICGVAVAVGDIESAVGVVGTSLTQSRPLSDNDMHTCINVLHNAAAQLSTLRALANWPTTHASITHP